MEGERASIVIRPESSDDHLVIRELVAAAFESDVEADLVDRIRTSPEYVAEMALVAEVDGDVVGHAVVSNAVMRSASGDRRISMLAPLSVRPDRQRSGVGSALVRAALALADERGEPLVVVEGSPDYYRRFGFEHSALHGIEIDLPDWAPPEAAQVKPLSSLDPDDATLRGKVIYPTTFDGV